MFHSLFFKALLLSSLVLTLWTASASAAKRSQPDEEDVCTHLTSDADFASPGGLVMQTDKTVLVYFHAPWCTHCKQLTPQYRATCLAFANEPSVVTAMISMEAPSDAAGEAESMKALRNRLGVTGYPTLLLFPETHTDTDTDTDTDTEKEAKTWVAYTGPRKHKDMLSFINEQAGTYRLANGTLGNDAAVVPQLQAIIMSTSTYDAAFLNMLETAIGAIEAASTVPPPVARKEVHGMYRSYASKVVERGQQYPQQEVQRLTRLMQNPLTLPAKVDLFQKKLNVISQFLGADSQQYGAGGKPGLVQALDRLILEASSLDDAFAASLATAAEPITQSGIDCTHYVLYAQKIAGNGLGYITKELKRLGGLLSSSRVLQHKKVNLQVRFNILRQFQLLFKGGEGQSEGEAEL